MELKSRAYNITDYCTYHLALFFFRFISPPFALLSYVRVFLCDFVCPGGVDRHPKLVRDKNLVGRGYRAKVVMPSSIHKVVYCVAMCHIHNARIRIFL